MADDHSKPTRATRPPARFIAPMAGAGLVIACGIVLFKQQQPPGVPVSEVERQVVAVALAGGKPNAEIGDGAFGPWIIAADRQDPTTGYLEPFRVEYESVLLTAESAEIRIDAENDAFSFVLRDVIFVHAPEDGTTQNGLSARSPEGSLHTVAIHELGPIPYGRDIIPDGTSGAGTIPSTPARPRSPVADASSNDNADAP
jgi:hypothetical protein